jgi:hypothetical protein
MSVGGVPGYTVISDIGVYVCLANSCQIQTEKKLSAGSATCFSVGIQDRWTVSLYTCPCAALSQNHDAREVLQRVPQVLWTQASVKNKPKLYMHAVKCREGVRLIDYVRGI